MKSLYLILAGIFLLYACNPHVKSAGSSFSSVEVLRNRLAHISGKAILFGHQDDLAYGVGWSERYLESDVKRVTGSFPAVFGWDLGDIGNERNLDGVLFDSIRSYIISVHEMGGVNTISWHANHPVTKENSWAKDTSLVHAILNNAHYKTAFNNSLDEIANFLLSLKTKSGEMVPVIFRPFHEMNGNWFWWGADKCHAADYAELFRYTIDYLRDTKGVANMLVAYSPDRLFDTVDDYLRWYPGDDVVDILGMDNYWDFQTDRLDLVVLRLAIVADIAEERNKLAAFTETGCDKVTEDKWYTKKLLQVLKANEKTRKMAYVLVWRNADSSHFFVPYPGHSQSEDFQNFVKDESILLLDEFRLMEEN